MPEGDLRQLRRFMWGGRERRLSGAMEAREGPEGISTLPGVSADQFSDFGATRVSRSALHSILSVENVVSRQASQWKTAPSDYRSPLGRGIGRSDGDPTGAHPCMLVSMYNS